MQSSKLFGLILCALLASAVSVVAAEPMTMAHLKAVATRNGISPSLLRNIANTESGNNIYALNLQSKFDFRDALREADIRFKYGRSHDNQRWIYDVSPRSKQEAVSVMTILGPKCTGFDVGLFQVSIGKMRDYHIDPVEMLDPHYNLEVAAKIVRQCQDKEKTLWRIAECYHQGSFRGSYSDYSRLVYQSYQRQSLSPGRQ